jgi:hypothetical protein
MLVSRDDQSCLVVSYREIKACVEAAYKSVVPKPLFGFCFRSGVADLISANCGTGEVARG